MMEKQDDRSNEPTAAAPKKTKGQQRQLPAFARNPFGANRTNLLAQNPSKGTNHEQCYCRGPRARKLRRRSQHGTAR